MRRGTARVGSGCVAAAVVLACGRASLCAALPPRGAAAAVPPGSHSAAPAPRLVVYQWRNGVVVAPPGGPAGPLPVGSLAKPFVARAWASSHPGTAPPSVRCTPASRCWNASGHGTLGLVRATALSCNTYFRTLAADTPASVLEGALRSAGFRAPEPLTPETAIGLPGEAGLLSAEPSSVLRAYAGLLRDPWPGAESVRAEVIAGLHDSARDGTAAGLGRGFAAKTGTVPSLDGTALSTSGWAVAMDGAERGFLALLTPGTGRDAARALGRSLRASEAVPAPDGGGAEPGSTRDVRRDRGDWPGTGRDAVTTDRSRAAGGRVSVSLFGALAPRRVLARNVGPAPLSTSRGFVGAGGSIELGPGDRLAEGLWELRLPASGLVRRLRAAVRLDAAPRDVLRVRAVMAAAEYVAGVIAAELGERRLEANGLGAEKRALRTALGAAVLRFLREGPRHGDVDRCDLTHCAFFVGRGPRTEWTAGGRAVAAPFALLTPAGRGATGLRPAPFDDDEARASDAQPLEPALWREMLALSAEPGPARWTSHCGGAPLSAHAVWGGDDRRVFACRRHGSADEARWERRWDASDVERAFGPAVLDLRVLVDDGQWRLEVQSRDGRQLLAWDTAHARLAGVLGWGALPSPADRVVREADGYRAIGRGLGHRVGLCLAASATELD